MAMDRATRRATWIAAAAIVGLALVVGVFLAPHRDAQTAAEPAPVAVPVPSPASQVAERPSAPLSPTPHAEPASLAASTELAPSVPSTPTQVAVSGAQGVPDASADSDGADAASAPKLSAEEQGLADAVGDTRRASPAAANAGD